MNNKAVTEDSQNNSLLTLKAIVLVAVSLSIRLCESIGVSVSFFVFLKN